MPDWIHAEENRVSLGDDRRFALWTELELETAKVSQSKSIHTLRSGRQPFLGGPSIPTGGRKKFRVRESSHYESSGKSLYLGSAAARSMAPISLSTEANKTREVSRNSIFS